MLASLTIKMCERFSLSIAYLDEESAPNLLDAVGRTYISDPKKHPKMIDWFKTPQLPEKRSWMTFIQLIRTLTELVQGPLLQNQ